MTQKNGRQWRPENTEPEFAWNQAFTERDSRKAPEIDEPWWYDEK